MFSVFSTQTDKMLVLRSVLTSDSFAFPPLSSLSSFFGQKIKTVVKDTFFSLCPVKVSFHQWLDSGLDGPPKGPCSPSYYNGLRLSETDFTKIPFLRLVPTSVSCAFLPMSSFYGQNLKSTLTFFSLGSYYNRINPISKWLVTLVCKALKLYLTTITNYT